MSWGASIHERISIRNDGETAAKLTEELQRYLQQINHMASLESIYGLRLTLSDGAHTVDFDRDGEEEPGNTYVVTPEGLRQKRAEHTIWPDGHPVADMMKTLGAAKQITMEWSAGLMQLHGAAYGEQYWEPRLREAAPTDCVDYRTLETNDFAACVGAFHSDESGACVEVPRTDPLSAVVDIQKCHASNFRISIEEVPRDKWTAFCARFQPLHSELLDRFDAEYVSLELFDHNAYVDGGVTIRGEQLPELVDLVQRMVDIAAEFGVTAQMEDTEFEPWREEGRRFEPFVTLGLELRDGKVAMECCRYDA